MANPSVQPVLGRDKRRTSQMSRLRFSAAGVFAGVRPAVATARALLASPEAALLGLVCSGLALELALVHWWLGALSLVSHPGFPAPGQDALIWLLGNGESGMDHFLLLLAVAFAPYLLALALAQRASGRAALTVAIFGAVVLGLAMLVSFPAGAIDIFHNIMDGRLIWLYHLSPSLVPPSAVSGDPLFGYLHYWQDVRSAYGPVWFLITAPAYLAGGDSLTRNILAYKALPFAFELVSLLLIVLILGRTDPKRTVAGVVCFGWNPLVLWEVAGNGHNDIVMMCFVLAALLLLLTSRWPFAFTLLACSVMVKFVSLALLPVFVVWIPLRHGRHAVIPMISGLLGALLLSLVVLFPFWAGPRTFSQLRAQTNQVIFSPASALIGDWGENLPASSRTTHVKYGFTAAFAVLYLVVLMRLRRTAAGLLRACVEVMFLLLTLMTWWFWPWYVVWGLALATLLPGSGYARLFVLFSATAMLVYVSSAWRQTLWNFTSPVPLAVGTALLVFLPPILYALLELGRSGTVQVQSAKFD